MTAAKSPQLTLNLNPIDQFTVENAYLSIEPQEQNLAIERKQNIQATMVEIRRGLGDAKAGSSTR